MRKIKDAEFGALMFTDYGDRASYSCRLTLPGSSKEVDVFFDTTNEEHLPTEQQRKFFKRIIENYGTLVDKIIPVISGTIAIDPTLKGKVIIKSDLQLVSFGIPQVDIGISKWDLTFEATSLKGIYIIVYFEQFTPLSATIEKNETPSWINFLLRLLNRRS